MGWHKDPQYSSLWPKDYKKVCAAIDFLIEKKEKGWKIHNSVGQLEHFKKYFKDPDVFVKKGGCHLGYNALSVNQSGDIFLCLSKPPIGNIMRDTIEKVWESDYANNIRQEIRKCTVNCKSMINCFPSGVNFRTV